MGSWSYLRRVCAAGDQGKGNQCGLVEIENKFYGGKT